MLFLSKKILSSLLLPLPLAIILLFIGLVLSCLHRQKKISGSLLGYGFVILVLFSFCPIPYILTHDLESRYQPLTKLPTNVNTIVVLGGGVRSDTSMPPNTQLGSASLARLIEGIRLYKLLLRDGKQPKLILSGGRVFGLPSEAGILENTAIILGVNKKNIILENGSKDTAEEAENLKSRLSNKPFILVTSATHMPRAMFIFQQAGTKPIAAPTQFIATKSRSALKRFLPSSNSLMQADISLHEYLGMAWAQIQKYHKEYLSKHPHYNLF